MNSELLNSIEKWHQAGEHKKIIEAINYLPHNKCEDELVSLMARALNNQGEYLRALDILDSIKQTYSDNPYFCLRYAFALYELHREDEALFWFKKAEGSGIEEINETPDTYHPTSVKKWVTFAERWAPRRIEKNQFEAARRANRNIKKAAVDNLEHFDFEGFWLKNEYADERYVGNPPSNDEIEAVEQKLGYKLPESYKTLIKKQNGGLLMKGYFDNPMQNQWSVPTFKIESLFGIDHNKPGSLCGKFGSKFWINEWKYPNIGIAIGEGMTGHDMFFLDYSGIASDDEPCVVHISQDSGYEITYLADSFGDFIKELYYSDEEDEDLELG